MSWYDELRASFRDRALLDRALVHASYVNEHPQAGESNERLEFLGDGVVNLALADALFALAPAASEGDLSRRRWDLASRQSLTQVARRLDLGRYLLLGRGEVRDRESTLGSAFEAVVGALFLDGGYERARDFVLRALRPDLERVASQGAAADAKTSLQQLALARGLGLPAYRLLGESGPPHARRFEVEVAIGQRALGHGFGLRRQEAEQTAAAEALRRLR